MLIYTYTFMHTHIYLCKYTKSRSLSLLLAANSKAFVRILVFRNLKLNRILWGVDSTLGA